MKDKETKRIVIVGSGFGGVYAYLEAVRQARSSCEDFEIILLGNNDRFEFTPMIHEVATGNLTPASVWQSLRTLPQSMSSTFVQGHVTNVLLDENVVEYAPIEGRAGAGRDQGKKGGGQGFKATEIKKLAYDYLVLATGAKACFFNVLGAEKYTLPLKTLESAMRIKSRVINQFEEAQQVDEAKEKSKSLTFVVVGGGPTGVELAGELADLLHKELKRAFPREYPYVSLFILDSGDRLLKRADIWFSKKAKKILEKKGVKCILEERVKEVTSDKLLCLHECVVETKTVFWTAGVEANLVDLEGEREVERDERSKRIKVTPTLNLKEYENVFVVGDGAWVLDRETQKPYSMRAQFAVREGQLAVRNIFAHMCGKDLKEFYWNDQGFLVSLGKGGALAEILMYNKGASA